MEKKSVTKKIVKLSPDGSCVTTYTDAMFRSVQDVTDDMADERRFYSSTVNGVQSIEEAADNYVLSILQTNGTITMISYTARD